ncbi:MAG: uroporphyrinogen decarboxylase family protein [Candidatus Zipacnadales bacterium]
MTPRQAILESLHLRRPKGDVPHCELEFQLTEEALGKVALRAHHLEGASGVERDRRLHENAEMWIEVAERFGWSVITGLHWLSLEDQVRSFKIIKDLVGDRYMLSVFADGTFAIPNGENMTQHVIWLTEKRDEAHAQAAANVQRALEVCRRLIGEGAEIVFMCADYCFNDGPFLSPRMFAEYVTPYLAQLVEGIKQAGGYAVKHTDGNVMPILDQIVDTGIHGLHSLDPMAGVDIAEVKRLYGDRICLFGNVNCALVQAGTFDDIETSARYCLQHGGVESGGYVYSTSNCIFKGVPLANYEHMLQVRERYCRELNSQ